MNDQSEHAAPVIYRRQGAVGIIELSKPARFNCLSLAMFRLIAQALGEFENEGQVRAVLVQAQGKNFCTGAELDEVEAVGKSQETLRAFLELGHQTLRRFEISPLPIIAAVQGLCLAGGLELAVACDVILAADTARFGDQHAAFGLIPGWGNSQRLPRAIGLQRARDLMFSARWLDAATALQWGLISRVVPADQLSERALDYAQQLSVRSRPGIAAMKSLSLGAMEGHLEEGLQREVTAACEVLLGADAKEGIAAFKQRRQPGFA